MPIGHAPHRYAYSKSYSEYHAAAVPLLKPIKGVKLRLPGKIRNDPKEVRQLGPLFEDMHPVVPDNGLANFYAAFRKRCNYHSNGRATPAIIAAAQEFVKTVVPNRLPTFNWTENLFETWLDKFGIEKRNRMVSALETMPEVTKKEYGEKELFVKVENLLVQHKPNWAPRVIFKSHDLNNAIAGPIFNELLGRFNGQCDSMKGKYQFRLAYKKVPTDYTGFVSSGPGEYVECDFSSNDKFQCSDVIILEMALMRRLGCPEWFIRLHASTNKFTVKNREHGLKATLENMLPTGCPDTTFRNCFWNGCILWSFLTRVGATSCRAVILGDDMLAKIDGLKRNAAKTYSSIASEAQMEAKVFRRRYLLDCTFVSRFFVPAGLTHLTVPIIGKALARFNMRANYNTSLTDDQYMAGKSIGGAYEFRHLEPVRNAFILRFHHHWEKVLAQRQKDKHLPVELSWNAKSAGVTLKNIKEKIFSCDTIPDLDFHGFCYHRYGLGSTEVVEFCEDVILNTGKVDISGTIKDLMARDFL